MKKSLRCNHCRNNANVPSLIWTAKQNSDFIGLVTAVMNENFTGDVFVADMMRMPGNSHTAENIKEAIEAMVN